VGEKSAEAHGIAEMRKELANGATPDQARYRGWLKYHNQHGGRQSWADWSQRRDLPDQEVRKEPVMKKSIGNPFAQFDDRVANAEQALQKATASGDTWETAAARSELGEARRQRTLVKMIASEHARDRDPGLLMRSLRGQGVPLLSNRHALPDDPSLQGI